MYFVELQKCEYFLTSETDFNDRVSFINETPGNGTRFHFYTLSRNTINFRLSNDTSYDMQNNAYTSQYDFGKCF